MGKLIGEWRKESCLRAGGGKHKSLLNVRLRVLGMTDDGQAVGGAYR